MAIAWVSEKDLGALRKHRHYSFWEVAIYGRPNHPGAVTVECTKCGEVLIELVNRDLELAPKGTGRSRPETKRRLLKEAGWHREDRMQGGRHVELWGPPHQVDLGYLPPPITFAAAWRRYQKEHP